MRLRHSIVSCGLRGALLALALCLAPGARAEPADAKPVNGLERWRLSRAELYMNDFGELARYRDDNARLQPATPGEDRVVFLGDSITDAWPLAEFFPGKPYVNRGISGQTTAQMLVRFRQDVIQLQPKAVLILAGTNDIAGNTGPMRLEDIEANYASLADLAAASGIKAIFASVLPVNNYTPGAQDFFAQRSPAKILDLNSWLKSYCAAHGCLYLDYFSRMVDAHGLLRKELAEDGLHPNPDGYRIMTPLAAAAIRQALGGT